MEQVIELNIPALLNPFQTFGYRLSQLHSTYMLLIQISYIWGKGQRKCANIKLTKPNYYGTYTLHSSGKSILRLFGFFIFSIHDFVLLDYFLDRFLSSLFLGHLHW